MPSNAAHGDCYDFTDHISSLVAERVISVGAKGVCLEYWAREVVLGVQSLASSLHNVACA